MDAVEHLTSVFRGSQYLASLTQLLCLPSISCSFSDRADALLGQVVDFDEAPADDVLEDDVEHAQPLTVVETVEVVTEEPLGTGDELGEPAEAAVNADVAETATGENEANNIATVKTV